MSTEMAIAIWVRLLETGAVSIAAACLGFVAYMEREHRRDVPPRELLSPFLK